MDTKIKASFWADGDIEPLSTDHKLALLWMLTNSRINLCGILQTTPRQFAFETGLPEQALWDTVQALPRALKGFKEKGIIYCRNFIRHQFGSGNSLKKNNVFRGIQKSVGDIRDPQILMAIGQDYPELIENSHSPESPSEGLEGVREEKRREEQSREEKSQGIEVQEKGGKVWEPNGHQQRINSWFNRRDTTPWSEKERRAFRHLPETSPEDWDSLEDRYTSNSQNYRRREIITLLNNWQGEIDLANNPNPVNGQQPSLPEGRL